MELHQNIIIGLLSMAGCACMLAVCAMQVRELLGAARRLGAAAHSWEMERPLRRASPPAHGFAPPGLWLSRL
jgi:hypothetical protein